MWLNPITILFRILNVIALIAVAVYFFKRYAYPAIRESQNQKAQAAHDLEEQKELLAEQQSVIDEQMRAQEALRGVLLERLKTWHDASSHQKQVLAHERNQLHEQFARQMVERVKWAQYERMERLLIPDAVVQARQQLQRKFATGEYGPEYLALLIATMEKQ